MPRYLLFQKSATTSTRAVVLALCALVGTLLAGSIVGTCEFCTGKLQSKLGGQVRESTSHPWKRYGLEDTEIEDIVRLKERLRREVYSEAAWNELFKDEFGLVSCNYTDAVDFVYNNKTFASNVARFLEEQHSVSLTTPIRSPIVEVPRSSANAAELYQQLNMADASNVSFVLVSAGYGRGGSFFYRCDTEVRKSNQVEVALLEHPSVKRWWVSNHECHYHHHKLSYLPLGATEFCDSKHFDAFAQPLQRSRQMVLESDSHEVESLLYLSLGLRGPLDKIQHRQSVIDALQRSFPDLENVFSRGQQTEFFINTAKSVYGVSPRGIASSCYRHYHVLLSAAVPLMDDHHTLRRIFHGLPVVFVRDWSRVDAAFLAREAHRLLRIERFAWEKLHKQHWTAAIRASAQPAR